MMLRLLRMSTGIEDQRGLSVVKQGWRGYPAREVGGQPAGVSLRGRAWGCRTKLSPVPAQGRLTVGTNRLKRSCCLFFFFPHIVFSLV